MNSYDIVSQSVRDYWKTNFLQPVIALFFQKYDFEKEWEWCEVLAYPQGIYNWEDVLFYYNFYGGQTQVKDITIVSIYEVTEFYIEHHKLKSPD